MTIGFDEAGLRQRWHPAPTAKRGAPFRYAAIAIQALLALKAVLDLPDRRVDGLAGSIVQLMGVEWRIPEHTRLSRRANPLTVRRPRRQRTGPVHGVVASTGLNRDGEGESKGRQHRVSKRRTWRKVHVAMDADAQDVIGIEVTTQTWTDGEVFGGGLEQVDGDIIPIDGESAYHHRQGYHAALQRGTTVAVPPRHNAVPWEADHRRPQAVATIADKGLAEWKKAVGDHRRRIAENGR